MQGQSPSLQDPEPPHHGNSQGLGAATRLRRTKQSSGLSLLLRDAQRGFTARRNPLSLPAKRRPQMNQRPNLWSSLSKDQNQLRRCCGKDQGEAGSANSLALLCHLCVSCPAALSGEAMTLKSQKKNTWPLLLLFPSSDEPRQLLPIKVSRSLEQALEKLNMSSEDKKLESSCTGRDKLMDGTGIAHGKFSTGFCMTGSVQSVSAAGSAACKPAKLCLGGTLGWSVLS